jgi:hypothetical protein
MGMFSTSSVHTAPSDGKVVAEGIELAGSSLSGKIGAKISDARLT